MRDLGRWWVEAYPRLVGAAERLLRQRATAVVSATDLVHEVYVRLDRQGDRLPRDRRLVATFAKRVMRQVLIDQQRRSAVRRAAAIGPRERTAEVLDPLDRLALEEALAALRVLRPKQHRLLRLRYYRGLTLDECALRMKLSPATLEREMARARAWLVRKL